MENTEILKLEISVKGKATSNIALYQKSALAQIEQLKSKELVTDEDFVSAEKVVKICKGQEKALEDAKTAAQDESKSIKDVFAEIEAAKNIFRDTRLDFEKQIKTEKVRKKQLIISTAFKKFNEFKAELEKRYDFKHIPFDSPVENIISNATDRKKTVLSMQTAVDQTLEDFKIKVANVASQIFSNIQIVKGRENQNLFPDVDNLAMLAPDLLMAEISKREEAHKKEVERIRIETEQRVESERIKKEEEEKRIAEQKKIDEEKTSEKEEPFQSEIPNSEKFSGHNPDNPAPDDHFKSEDIDEHLRASDNQPAQSGFAKPPVDPVEKVKEVFPDATEMEVSYRIEVSGSWEFSASPELAKQNAVLMRQRFGNSVKLIEVKK